jgi:beta-glucosidase
MDSKSIKPRFEFGFGLSYTTFAYSGLSLTQKDGGLSASFTVKNTGSLVGTEIAQLYLGYPSSAGEPKRVLRGFEEVLDLGVGQERQVTITVAQREMSVWDVVKQSYVKPVGTFTVWIGASIEDIRLSGTV